MQLKEIRNIFRKELGEAYPREEVDEFFYQGIQALLGLEKFILVLDPDLVVDKNAETRFFALLQGLKDHQPIQYLLGEMEFRAKRFQVRPGVLIPRPETEELVSWILDENQGRKGLKVLDIGTGSGCIAISLASELESAEVTALDVSSEALEVCKGNAMEHEVAMNYLQCDILTEDPEGEWDIIVSNPPYVLESEKEEMRPNVLLHEPHLALFVPEEDPLRFYRRIAHYAWSHLREGGRLYFEINEAFGDEVAEMMEALNFETIEIRKDMFGKDRFVGGTYPG